MRADARRNREIILQVARTAVAQDGTEASLRKIARDAGIGLGTLYRHFPTRDALLQEILQSSFDELTRRADILAGMHDPLEALEIWVDELVASTSTHQGLAASMVDKLREPASSLYEACASLRRAGDRLLGAAQSADRIRPDMEGADLMSLVSAIAWLTDREALTVERRRHLFNLIMDGLKK
ncbi:hypothetical protein ASE00_16485 [Sphingomonas sp. Root710]|nr:hypothetical protein ASE00_16485 [Sphingomonas sp. Root710]